MRKILASAFVAFSLAGIATAQNRPDWSVRDKTLAAYFRAETEKLRDACLADIKTLDDWKAKRDTYRKQLFEMLSLDPLPERTDLKATTTGRVEKDDFVVENVHFQSRPGLYVTGNLYLPKKIDKPAPAILYLCGHGGVKKDGISYGNKVHYQHHGIWFARHGYVCLVIDSLQLGEIEATHHGTYRYDMWWWNSRGYTPAGVEAWNCIRTLDYLQSRKEVDPEKIGATGRSGGGAYSWSIAALDERIKVAVPVAGITDLENHVIDGCVEGHCDCMYFVNTYRWDYPQMAALVAPRPLLISNTDKDGIFPLDGVARTHAIVRRIYQLHGAENNLGLHITEGPHADTQELYTHAFVWFDRFLMGERRPIDGPALPMFEPQELRVFDKLPEDQLNTSIHDTFVPEAKLEVPADGEAWRKMRDATLAVLKDRVFPALYESTVTSLTQESSAVQDGIHIRGLTFNCTENRHGQTIAELPVLVVQPEAKKPNDKVTIIVLDQSGWDEIWPAFWPVLGEFGKSYLRPAANPAKFSTLAAQVRRDGRALVYVAPRGVGPMALTSNPKKAIQERRRFMLLGQTMEAVRIAELGRLLDELPYEDIGVESARLTLQADGNSAVTALYTALRSKQAVDVILTSPPPSHRDGPDLLNVMRFTDLPMVAAMVAERASVTIETADPKPWQLTKDIAAKLGWGEEKVVIRAPAGK